MTPINESFTDEEFIVRNVYHSSQYSNKNGLKKNYLYPNYTKQSQEFTGRHVCRVSVQRVCYGGWQRVTDMAMKTKRENQELVGFSLAPASIVSKYGFSMEPAARDTNVFHAHIYIPELDLQYPNENVNGVMMSGLKRKLDEMTEDFEFMFLEDIPNKECRHYKPFCKGCLGASTVQLPDDSNSQS